MSEYAINENPSRITKLAREDIEFILSDNTWAIQLSPSATERVFRLRQPKMWQMVQKDLIAGHITYELYQKADKQFQMDTEDLPGGRDAYQLHRCIKEVEFRKEEEMVEYWIRAVREDYQGQYSRPQTDLNDGDGISHREDLLFSAEHIGEPGCGNCDRRGHTIGDCIKTDESGTVPGCARCNTPEHATARCSHLPLPVKHRWDELFYYTVIRRTGKPPLRTDTWDWYREAAIPHALALRSYPLLAKESLDWTAANSTVWTLYDYFHGPGLQLSPKVKNKEMLVADKTLSCLDVAVAN